MKRWLVLSVAALGLGLACVPSTDEGVQPRGAVGVTITPRPETAGAPFVTSDGWTIKVTTIAMYVDFQVDSDDDRVGSGSVQLLFRANHPVQGIIRALEPMPFHAAVWMTPRGAHQDDLHNGASLSGDLDLLPRFQEAADSNQYIECPHRPECDTENPPDDCFPSGPPYCGQASAPSLWIVVDATKGARKVHLDVTLDGNLVPFENRTGPVLTVVPDALTSTTATIDVVRFFENSKKAIVFDDIAVADADGDGTITKNELETVTEDITFEVRGDGYTSRPSDAVPEDGFDGGRSEQDAALLATLPPSTFDDDDPSNDLYRVSVMDVLKLRMQKMVVMQ